MFPRRIYQTVSYKKINYYYQIKVVNRWVFEHRYIYQQANGQIPKGYIIHHKNFNSLDNSLSNLQLMSRNEHNSYHSKLNPTYGFQGKHCTLDHKEKLRNLLKGRHYQSGENKIKQSNRMKVYWRTLPESKKEILSQKRKDFMLGSKNPTRGKKRIFSQETIEKIRQANIGRIHTQESKNNISKALKGHVTSGLTRLKIKYKAFLQHSNGKAAKQCLELIEREVSLGTMRVRS